MSSKEEDAALLLASIATSLTKGACYFSLKDDRPLLTVEKILEVLVTEGEVKVVSAPDSPMPDLNPLRTFLQ